MAVPQAIFSRIDLHRPGRFPPPEIIGPASGLVIDQASVIDLLSFPPPETIVPASSPATGQGSVIDPLSFQEQDGQELDGRP